eukprot:SAG22_NODE_3293_length_1799_cov_1.537059_2_plen_103_part_00
MHWRHFSPRARSMDLTCGALLPLSLALLVRALEIALDRSASLVLERVFRVLDVEQGCRGFAVRHRRGRNRGGGVPDRVGQVMEYASAHSIAAKEVTTTANVG